MFASGDVHASEKDPRRSKSMIDLDVFEIPADAVAIEREVVLGGRAVDVVEVDGAMLVIAR